MLPIQFLKLQLDQPSFIACVTYIFMNTFPRMKNKIVITQYEAKDKRGS